MSISKLLAYAAIYILWGGSFLAIRVIVAEVPPFFAAGFRFTLAGLLLIAYSHLRGEVACPKRALFNAAVLGFIMFTIMYAALFWGEIHVSSGIAAVVSAMIPVWIFAGELTVLRTQKATVLSIAGILLGLTGVVVLAGGTRSTAGQTSGFALAALVGATICWSGGTLLSRRLTLPAPQTDSAGWQMASGGVLLLALSLVSGELRRLPASGILFSAKILMSMAYLVIAASILAYTAYVWLIAHEPATRVSSYAYVNPVIALILGTLLAGERLSAFQMTGVALVLAGVVATLAAKRPVAEAKKVAA
ncbi:MAG TPA: EamA family transporter [Pseudacidobacterium sp.]|nr:EamA family transporter [Pseudacidobacterium sp.]